MDIAKKEEGSIYTALLEKGGTEGIQRCTVPHLPCTETVGTGENNSPNLCSLFTATPAKQSPISHVVGSSHSTETQLHTYLQSHSQMPNQKLKQEQDRLLWQLLLPHFT